MIFLCASKPPLEGNSTSARDIAFVSRLTFVRDAIVVTWTRSATKYLLRALASANDTAGANRRGTRVADFP